MNKLIRFEFRVFLYTLFVDQIESVVVVVVDDFFFVLHAMCCNRVKQLPIHT